MVTRLQMNQPFVKLTHIRLERLCPAIFIYFEASLFRLTILCNSVWKRINNIFFVQLLRKITKMTSGARLTSDHQTQCL